MRIHLAYKFFFPNPEWNNIPLCLFQYLRSSLHCLVHISLGKRGHFVKGKVSGVASASQLCVVRVRIVYIMWHALRLQG